MKQEFYDALKNGGFNELQIFNFAMINERRENIEGLIDRYQKSLKEIKQRMIKEISNVYPVNKEYLLNDTVIKIIKYNDIYFNNTDDIVFLYADVLISGKIDVWTIDIKQLMEAKKIDE